jgi:hypothetical protein
MAGPKYELLPQVTITVDPIEIPYARMSTLLIVYPAYEDWLALFNFSHTLTKGDTWNRGLYADMRKSFQNSVTRLLDTISRRSVGSAVLSLLKGAKYAVRIYPFIFDDKRGDWKTAEAVTRLNGSEAKSWAKGMPIEGANFEGKIYRTKDNAGNIQIGTGRGVDTDVYVAPDQSKSDETLLHEMVHAVRGARGKRYRHPVSGGYGNLEEFLAATVANMYRSQKGTPLYDYQWSPINPATFLDTDLKPTPRLLLSLTRRMDGDLFDKLAGCQAPFNPLSQINKEAAGASANLERH